MTSSTVSRSLRRRCRVPSPHVRPDEVEPEVEHGGRVGQRPDRDAVRPGRGVGADGVQGDAAGDLGEDAVPARRGGPRRWPRPRSPGSMLSSSTASAPARAASATCSSASHSISTRARATAARARATASVMLVPARWLSLTSTASERPTRWLVPPPARTAAFSRRRRPGRGLAGVEHRDRRVACVRRRHERAVSVAMPERWPRKFSAVRSAVRIGPQRAGHLEHGVARLEHGRRRRRATRARAPGPSRRKVASARRRPASTPAWRARSA